MSPKTIAICHALREYVRVGKVDGIALSTGRWAGCPYEIFNCADMPSAIEERISGYKDVTNIAARALQQWPPRAEAHRLGEETRRIKVARHAVVWCAVAVARRPYPDHAAQDVALLVAVDEYEAAIEARAAACGHPNASAVSGPLPGVTEYYCEDCESYFTRDDEGSGQEEPT